MTRVKRCCSRRLHVVGKNVAPKGGRRGGGGGGHFLCGVWYPFSLWSVVPFFAVECGTLFLCGVWYPFFSVECETLFLCGVWYPFSLWSVVPFFSVERGTLFLCRVSYPSSVEAGHSVQEEVSFIKARVTCHLSVQVKPWS